MLLIIILIILSVTLFIVLYSMYRIYILDKKMNVVIETLDKMHPYLEGIQEIEEEEVAILRDIVEIITDEDEEYERKVVN